MGKLFYQSEIFHDGEEVPGKTIVDVLTDNESRTSVLTTKEPGRIVQPRLYAHGTANR